MPIKNSLKDRELERLFLKIPEGKVTTYKILAERLKVHPRKIGKMLSKNSNPNIPCYKVVHSNGKLGNYRFGGKKRKAELLKKEGIEIEKDKIVNLAEYLFCF